MENLDRDKDNKYKEPLEVGDRVICVQMDDYAANLHMGDKGTVTEVKKLRFDGLVETFYYVKWDKGSNLPLIDTVDKWLKEKNLRKNKSNVEESVITKKDFLNENFYADNKDFFKHFNWSLIRRFLNKVRDSGVTNMNGASPYLHMGSERIKGLHGHEFVKDNYSDYDNEDYDDGRKSSFDEVVEMADQVKNEMISGTIKVLESENKEITISSVQRLLSKYCKKAMDVYVKTYGGTIR
jgi:hypothetical protein